VAGALGLLALYIFSIRPNEEKVRSIIENPPVISFTDSYPEPLPFGEFATDCCVASAFGMMLAGVFYKPRKKENITILEKADRSIPHA
jgi:hypothetical protein